MTTTTTVIVGGSAHAGVSIPSDAATLADLLASWPSKGSLVVLAADLVVSPLALSPVTDDPLAGTAAMVVPDRAGNVSVRHHRLVSIGTGHHKVSNPTHASVGALVIAEVDLADAERALVDLEHARAAREVPIAGDELVEAILVALVRSGIGVRGIPLVDVPWFRSPRDGSAAVEEATTVPENRIRGLLANRVDDGFYSTFVVRKVSKPLTRVALRLGWTPNAITLLSLAIGLAAAACFAAGSWWFLLAGAVFLQLSLIVDCVDGEVARARRMFSSLGAWLDASTDRIKEFAAYAGLAIGAGRGFGEPLVDAWWLAVALVALQTSRHVSDYDFAMVQRLRETIVPIRDVREVTDGLDRGMSTLDEAMNVSSRLNTRSWIRWMKKVIHMPIGERWLLMSVVVVAFGPRWALLVLLAAGVVALGYVAAGRLARTLSWRGSTPEPALAALIVQRDGSLLTRWLFVALPNSLTRGRFAWSLPGVLRGAELCGVALAVVVLQPTAVVVAFWAMFVIAFHHYDTLYRSLQGCSPPSWLTRLGFGWDGRLLVVIVALCLPWWHALFAVVVLWWVAWMGVVASVQWLRSQK